MTRSPDTAIPPPEDPVRPRIVRTLVYLGGHDRARIAEVLAAGPDALCIDLEDSTPVARRDDARADLAAIAGDVHAAGSLLFVRVNADRAEVAADVEACAGTRVHCINLPKVEHGRVVTDFLDHLDGSGVDLGVDRGSVAIRPVIETPLGVVNAFEIASSSPRVAYMGGVEGGVNGDLGGALGYLQTPDGRETFHLRSKVLIDVRAANVPFPIGGGTTSRHDVEGCVDFARENRLLGYTGVHCLADPDVVRAVNRALTPSLADLEEWSRLVPRLAEVERAGGGAAHLDGRVFDPVALDRMREQLALGIRLGLVDDVEGVRS